MKTKTEPFDFSVFDSSEYDIEAMEIDARHGNFSADNAEAYRFENIIRDSIRNGQFQQARDQCSQWGFNYELERARA
jgi:hypothetical protein